MSSERDRRRDGPGRPATVRRCGGSPRIQATAAASSAVAAPTRRDRSARAVAGRAVRSPSRGRCSTPCGTRCARRAGPRARRPRPPRPARRSGSGAPRRRAARRASAAAGEPPTAGASAANSSADTRAGTQVDQVVQPGGGPAEPPVPRRPVADHRVQRVHRAVDQQAGHAGDRAPQQRGDHRVRGVLGHRLGAGAGHPAPRPAAPGRDRTGRAAGPGRRPGRRDQLRGQRGAVLGGSSLADEGTAMGRELDGGDLDAARNRLPNLCGREPARWTRWAWPRRPSSPWRRTRPTPWWRRCSGARSRACRVCSATARPTPSTPWSATGRALPPVRLGRGPAGRRGEPAAVAAGRAAARRGSRRSSAGRPREALAAWRRDAAAHPSPNAGPVEAAFAGALGSGWAGARCTRTARRTGRCSGTAATPTPVTCARGGAVAGGRRVGGGGDGAVVARGCGRRLRRAVGDGLPPDLRVVLGRRVAPPIVRRAPPGRRCRSPDDEVHQPTARSRRTRATAARRRIGNGPASSSGQRQRRQHAGLVLGEL